MTSKVDYTFEARRFTYKYPLLTAITTQVNFWLFAFLLLSVILYFDAKAISIGHSLDIPVKLGPSIITAVSLAIFYGIILGIMDYYLKDKWSEGKPLGMLTFIKGIFYALLTILMFGVLRHSVWGHIIIPIFFDGVSPIINETAWRYYFYITAVYTFCMGFVVSFILQINKRFGPGILLPVLLGKYREPQEEERIFMFFDLQSSTRHAEKLGHLKYSELLRECFLDINRISLKYHAEIYQYVGDEVVLCWPINRKIDPTICLSFYFACRENFDKHKDRYMEKYGILPIFKAGIHLGWVTGVEVGNIKRELAYHGDTLNVAARIQSKCNEFNCSPLISEVLADSLDWNHTYHKECVGTVTLKGRQASMTIYKVYKEPGHREGKSKKRR